MTRSKIRLGVNIDHIAFIKKSRDTDFPNLQEAVLICQDAGADLITIHLREDRRHIQDDDAITIRNCCERLNFEMANTDEMIEFAIKLKPNYCCIVPEKRDEKTTEGGLRVTNLTNDEKLYLSNNIKLLKDNDIEVSLFIDPVKENIISCKNLGAQTIELHTGNYANQTDPHLAKIELEKLIESAIHAEKCGLKVNAGHGLNYTNLREILCIPYLNEVNIGHSIIAESVFVGLKDAIKKIKSIIDSCD
tara:strand:- start:42 stop:785 length:744 start_codon:yes stop_codon:yes gene_type:complete